LAVLASPSLHFVIYPPVRLISAYHPQIWRVAISVGEGYRGNRENNERKEKTKIRGDAEGKSEKEEKVKDEVQTHKTRKHKQVYDKNKREENVKERKVREKRNKLGWNKNTVACKPLLGNDREISNYTTAITMQRLVNSNRGIVFSARSVPRCYKQYNLAIKITLWFSCCELLLWETGSSGREQFGNPEKGDRPPLYATTKQRQ
jgi:hypothetical protein